MHFPRHVAVTRLYNLESSRSSMCTPMIQLVSFFSPRSLEWPLGKILRPLSHRMDGGVRRKIINLDPLDDRFHYVRREQVRWHACGFRQRTLERTWKIVGLLSSNENTCNTLIYLHIRGVTRIYMFYGRNIRLKMCQIFLKNAINERLRKSARLSSKISGRQQNVNKMIEATSGKNDISIEDIARMIRLPLPRTRVRLGLSFYLARWKTAAANRLMYLSINSARTHIDIPHLSGYKRAVEF